MRIALILPAEGPEWGSVRAPNLGNEMICAAARRILKRMPSHNPQIEEITYLKRPSPEELRRINNCDRAILVGTNLFQPHTVGWEWRTEDLEQIEVPCSLYGVGYSGPLQGNPQEICADTRDLINWSRAAEAIGARDPHTLRWLKDLGLHSELIGCPVIAYGDAAPTMASGQGKPVLAVRRILLHDPGEEAVAAQRAMIDWYFKEYPDGLCVVQEQADLGLLEGKPVVTDFKEIVRVLSHARFVLSARLHAGMIALSLGRPAVFLAHDTRAASFCEMMGLPSRKLGFEGLKEAIHAIRAIERGSLAEFGMARERIPLFRERLEGFLGDILAESGKMAATREARTGKLPRQLQADFYEVKPELAGLGEQMRQEPVAPCRREAWPIEQLQARDQRIAGLQEQLQARDCELVELRRKLEEAQQKLTAIYNSLGWRLLESYWRWVNQLLPPGTRRHLWHSRLLRAGKVVLDEGCGSLWHRLKAKLRSKRLRREDTEELHPLPVKWEKAAKRSDRTRLIVLVPTMEAGGMERCTEILLRHFNRELFALGLVMIFDRQPFYEVPGDVETYILERYRQPRVKARLDELPPDMAAKYRQQLAWLEATAYKLGMLAQRLQPDVVLAQDYFASSIALLARKYMPSRVRVIGSAHIQYSGFMQIIENGDLYAALIRRHFNEADRIIAVSRGIATDHIENFGLRPEVCTVIHNPLDPAQTERLAREPVSEHPWLREEIPILLFVGRITPQKGLTYLFQATAQARKLERFRVVLIGEGEQRRELEALAQQLGIAEDVLFMGRQSNPFKFMRRATCFILPSVVEGMPYVLMEAMACGCAVIATDCVPGVRELLGEGERGILVRPKEPNALAEVILRVLWDVKLRERLSQAGRRYVNEFAADKIVAQYEKLVKAHAGIRIS